jgi:hypothetical protein
MQLFGAINANLHGLGPQEDAVKSAVSKPNRHHSAHSLDLNSLYEESFFRESFHIIKEHTNQGGWTQVQGKGNNYYEKSQKANRKKLDIVTQKKLSPRSPVPKDDHHGYSEKQCIEQQPVEPQSKPVYFSNRPRSKSGQQGRILRKPVTGELLHSSENSPRLDREKDDQTVASFSIRQDRSPFSSPLPSPLDLLSPLMNTRSATPEPQLSILKQAKCIPPPNFVSFCLPVVSNAPSSQYDTSTSILSDTADPTNHSPLPSVCVDCSNYMHYST